MRTQHAITISEYQEAVCVADEVAAAAVGLDQDVACVTEETDDAAASTHQEAGHVSEEADTAHAMAPDDDQAKQQNSRQRRMARRIAMAAAEAVRIAEETNADATGVVLDQATVHEHEAYQDAVYVVDDAEAAAAVEVAAGVLDQDAVCVADEETAAAVRLQYQMAAKVTTEAAKQAFLGIAEQGMPNLDNAAVQIALLCAKEYTEILPNLFLSGDFVPKSTRYLNGDINTVSPVLGLIVQCGETITRNTHRHQ